MWLTATVVATTALAVSAQATIAAPVQTTRFSVSDDAFTTGQDTAKLKVLHDNTLSSTASVRYVRHLIACCQRVRLLSVSLVA